MKRQTHATWGVSKGLRVKAGLVVATALLVTALLLEWYHEIAGAVVSAIIVYVLSRRTKRNRKLVLSVAVALCVAGVVTVNRLVTRTIEIHNASGRTIARLSVMMESEKSSHSFEVRGLKTGVTLSTSFRPEFFALWVTKVAGTFDDESPIDDASNGLGPAARRTLITITASGTVQCSPPLSRAINCRRLQVT